MVVSIKVTITINATAEKVWVIFMNPDYLKHWLTNFISIEHLSGKKGDVGSESKLKFLERGKEMEVIEKVLQVVPNEQYSFKMLNEKMETLVNVRLISLGQRTDIIQIVQFTPKGIFMKLMMPLLKGLMKKRISKEFQKLKDVIENNQKYKIV